MLVADFRASILSWMVVVRDVWRRVRRSRGGRMGIQYSVKFTVKGKGKGK